MFRHMRESMLRQTVHVGVASDTQTIQFLIGLNDIVRKFGPFVVTKSHFRWSDNVVVDMSIEDILVDLVKTCIRF